MLPTRPKAVFYRGVLVCCARLVRAQIAHACRNRTLSVTSHQSPVTSHQSPVDWGLATGDWRLPLPAAKESERGVAKGRRRVAEDGSVAAVGHDPETRLRNRAVQVDAERHRVERIAVAEHDESP